MVPDNHLFQLRFVDEALNERWRHRPGQFVELSVIGTGEVPISISSSPTRRGLLELCVRRVGRVTDALHRLPMNALVGVRGPYGNGFPIEAMEGHDLVIIAGGLGMAPLRSLLWYALDNREHFGNVMKRNAFVRPRGSNRPIVAPLKRNRPRRLGVNSRST